MVEHDGAILPQAAAWLLCASAVAVGTVVQRVSGAGFGLIAAPVMAIAAPGWMPGSLLLLGALVGVGALFDVYGAVKRADLAPGFSGRALGAVAAAMTASVVAGTDLLPILIGLIVLAAVILSISGFSLPITPLNLFGAGATAGVMGTLTGIGAPPMAILYATVESRRSAATQNAFFCFGMTVSIAALSVVGLIGAPQIALAAALAPVAAASLLAARPLARRFEKTAIRPWALGLATVSAVTLLGRALL